MADKDEKDDKGDKDAAKGSKFGKKKLIIIAVPAVLVLVAAAYFLFLKPGGSATAAGAAVPSPTPSYVAGLVVTLDPVSINLANAHFLKLGLALQATADAGEAVDGAKALDAAVELFSQKTMDELSTRDGREKAKAILVKRLEELYEHKVYDVYFTQFVMQ